MDIINTLRREPTRYEYNKSHILVPFKITSAEYNSFIYMPIIYISEEIKTNYGRQYNWFKRRYHDRLKQGEDHANNAAYVEDKEDQTYFIFMNIEDLERAKDLIENTLEAIYDRDTYSHNGFKDMIIPRFYKEDTCWRCIYDTIMLCSDKIGLMNTINVYNPDYSGKSTFNLSNSVIGTDFGNNIFNANGEIDDDILD